MKAGAGRGWAFLAARVSVWDYIGDGFTAGLWVNGWPLLGLRCRRNLPAGDRVWPGAQGEIRLLLCGWFVGWWFDPGY